MDRSASHLLGRDVDRGSKGSAERAYADCQDASSGDVTPMVAVRSRWHFHSPKRGNAPACGKRIRTLLCQCASWSPLAFRTALQSQEIKRMQNHAQREDFKRSVAVGLSQASCWVYVDASEPGSSIQVLGSFSSSALPVGSSYGHLFTCDRHLTRTVAPRPRALPPLRGGALRARPPADSEAAAGNIQVRRVCPPMHCRSGTGFT